MILYRNFPGINREIVEHVSCSMIDSEVGSCVKWCGRSICLMRSDCVRPVVPVRRNLLQRIARAWRIRSARQHLKQLVAYYGHIKLDLTITDSELSRWRQRIGAARVDLALAERP